MSIINIYDVYGFLKTAKFKQNLYPIAERLEPKFCLLKIGINCCKLSWVGSDWAPARLCAVPYRAFSVQLWSPTSICLPLGAIFDSRTAENQISLKL